MHLARIALIGLSQTEASELPSVAAIALFPLTVNVLARPIPLPHRALPADPPPFGFQARGELTRYPPASLFPHPLNLAPRFLVDRVDLLASRVGNWILKRRGLPT